MSVDLIGEKNQVILESVIFTGYTLEKYTQKTSEEVQIIRKADLENHNKDGGLWVVIHGKVYDVQDFKTLAPCGKETLMQYAGKEKSIVYLQLVSEQVDVHWSSTTITMLVTYPEYLRNTWLVVIAVLKCDWYKKWSLFARFFCAGGIKKVQSLLNLASSLCVKLSKTHQYIHVHVNDKLLNVTLATIN